MKLDAETADRLSLDAALGQLNPDAQALWEAYVREQPELMESAGIDRRTVALARQALVSAASTGTLAPLEPMPAPASRRVGARPVGAWAAALAAGLIVGMTLGLHLAPSPATEPAGEIVRTRRAAPVTGNSGAIAPVAPTMPAASTTQKPGNGFWSTERLYRHARQARPSAPTNRNVIWTSPVKPPILGDAL